MLSLPSLPMLSLLSMPMDDNRKCVSLRKELTDKMSFHEIDVALLRINHKLDQEKMRVFLQYIADEKLNSTNSTGIYK